ncbi:GNAT family N-acetyltransferase [Neorhizobium petrolearium]|uniref:GNAT family N-acetyltransferase n=1 Tax=Neorhizobium petrolearium TaxID=515361 RepID=UPI003F17F9C8
MLIRYENAADVDAIRDLTRAAFEPMPFSSNTEARIVDDLRASGDLTISLVAEEHGEVVGHVAFSPVAVDGVHGGWFGGGWFGLGPISVKPDRQRQGIGKALILRGLDLLRERGAAGCALVGSPEIYGRVGFESDGRLRYADIDPKFVQRIVLRGEAPSGVLKFAPAFEQ